MIGSIGCMGRPTRRMVDSRSCLTAASASNLGGASIAADRLVAHGLVRLAYGGHAIGGEPALLSPRP